MKTIRINGRLTNDEREVILVYNNETKTWIMDSTIVKFCNKASKQGWKQTVKYVYEDGIVCGGVFEAPARAITIRNAEKKQMTENQIGNLSGDDENEEDE